MGFFICMFSTIIIMVYFCPEEKNDLFRCSDTKWQIWLMHETGNARISEHILIQRGPDTCFSLKYFLVFWIFSGFLFLSLWVVISDLFSFFPFQITNYLLDTTRLLSEDLTYKASLEIEPKQSRLSVVSTGPSWQTLPKNRLEFPRVKSILRRSLLLMGQRDRG